jgi:hypothetical protein
MANRLLADRDELPVGKYWASTLLSDTKLKTHFNRRYDYPRAKCEEPTVMQRWFSLVENTIARYGIILADIYNFNETGWSSR